MTFAENIFILITLAFLLILAIRVKNIPWEKLGFTPKHWWKGSILVLVFSAIVFVLVQSLSQFVELPLWVIDKDPIINLLIAVILQEVIFRALLITWLEPWGKQRALWISTIIFAGIHLTLPDPWFLTSLTSRS